MTTVNAKVIVGLVVDGKETPESRQAVSIPEMTPAMLKEEFQRMARAISAKPMKDMDNGNLRNYTLFLNISANKKVAEWDFKYKVRLDRDKGREVEQLVLEAETARVDKGYPTDFIPDDIVVVLSVFTEEEDEKPAPAPVQKQEPITPQNEEMNPMNNINPALAAIFANMTPEQQQEIIESYMVQQAELSASMMVEEEEKVDTTSAPEWLKRAMTRLNILSKNAFVGFLVAEKIRAVDADTKAEVQKLIDELLANDDRWTKKTKPFIIAFKGWDDEEVNKAAEKAFEISLMTRQKTAAATEWVGDAIIKAGKTVKDNADNVGKVVASPVQGAAHLLSRKPEIKAPGKGEPQY